MANMYTTYQSGLMYQVFFNIPFTPPTGLYVALLQQPPTNTTYVEVPNAGTNYARQPCGISNGTGTLSWTFPYDASGLVYNKSPVTFPVATAYWGWVSGVMLFDSAVYSGGKGLFDTALAFNKEVATNDQIFLPASGILVRMS
jgi:hypothetical protein